jgi:hypothetical protein
MVLSVSNSKNILYKILISSLFLSSNAFATTSIRTCAELQNMNQNLIEQYVLANDIDCSDFAFKPIGSINTPFTGTFDGQGYKISYLKMNMSAVNNVALFAATKNAKIYNTQLNYVNITGNFMVASLIGVAQNTEIKNISANGKVTGKFNLIGGLIGLLKEKSSLSNSSTNIAVSLINVLDGGNIMGGLVGEVDDSFIDKSDATGAVAGYSRVGGLIGQMDSGSVTNSYVTGGKIYSIGLYTGGLIGSIPATQKVNVSYCYATSDISNSDYYSVVIGGLIGQLSTSSSSAPISISHCYSSGNINGTSSVGGLVGEIMGSYSLPFDTITISDSFSSRIITGGNLIGGAVGLVAAPFTLLNTYSTGRIDANTYGGLIGGYDEGLPKKGNVISSYWDMETSGITSPICGDAYQHLTADQCGVGKTTAEMYTQSTYVGWDFVNNWSIKENQSYPTLIGMK